MKKMLFSTLLLLVHYSCAVTPDTVPNDIREARTIFKSNLNKNENFAQLLSLMTQEVRDEFNEMIDEMWCFFSKIQKYCIEQIKENPLIEKYKQFMQKNSIRGSIMCSIDDKDQIELESRVKTTTNEELTTALQDFYETLPESEQIEFKEIMAELTNFFDAVRIDYEQMLEKYSSVEKAFAQSLEGSHKTLRIECGLEYPFPTFAYYIQ